jgi:NAD(P)-dependent dehydrogenase (short-subunit alcohol dehydrogenase family)
MNKQTLLATLLLLTALVDPTAWAGSHAAEPPGTVLITGSNRGIGLAFAGEYADRGWRVIATCRTPDRATELNELAAANPLFSVEELDVTSADEIAALAERYKDQPIDLLINNAAALGDIDAQRFGGLDYELFSTIVNVNLLGPLRVSEAFLDNVLAGSQKKIIILGSAAGTHALLAPGEQLLAYRSSKAGLHLAAHRMAQDLAPRDIIVTIINPGIVDTKGVLDLKPGDPVPDVFKPLIPLIESGELDLMRPAQSAAAMAIWIDRLGPEDSGRFINFDGSEMAW